MGYLLDTNVFIQAKNLHYGFDFCPAFWEWLITQNSTQRVFSIEQVAGEIAAGADELADWVSQRGQGFFLPADAAMLPALARLSAWATSQSFRQSAVSTTQTAPEPNATEASADGRDPAASVAFTTVVPCT